MLTDITTMLWKEWKELQQGSSRASGLVRLTFPIVLTGVLVPWRSGQGYITGAAAILSLMWILPTVAVSLTLDAVAGERERHTLESLLATRLPDDAVLFGKLSASVLYALALMIASLALGLLTVNVVHGHGTLLLFSPQYALTLLVVGFLSAILVCGAAVLVSVRASTVRQAAQTFAYGMMAVIFGTLFGLGALPVPRRMMLLRLATGRSVLRTSLIAGLIVAALDVVVILAAHRRFRRPRLIID